MAVRIGLIGCGVIAERVFLPLLPTIPGARLSAIVDTDPQRLQAARLGAPAAEPFENADALLAAAELDAVIVAAPTQLHAAVAEAAFNRGLHVYIEKPLATSLAEGARVVTAWRRAGTIGMVGFHGRFNPLYRRLRQAMRQGRGGSPVCVRTVFTTAPRELPAWKRRRSTGGGVLLDLASHHVDLVRFLFEREVAAVRATIQSRHSEQDTATLELELAGGVLVQSFFSLAAAERDHVEVYGEQARLSVSRFSSLDVDVRSNPGSHLRSLGDLLRRGATLRRVGSAIVARRAPLRDPGYGRALANFVAAAGGAPLPPESADVTDGMACLAVLEAAERSAACGRREEIETDDSGALVFPTSLTPTATRSIVP